MGKNPQETKQECVEVFYIIPASNLTDERMSELETELRNAPNNKEIEEDQKSLADWAFRRLGQTVEIMPASKSKGVNPPISILSQHGTMLCEWFSAQSKGGRTIGVNKTEKKEHTGGMSIYERADLEAEQSRIERLKTNP